jgi:maltose/maltodextrin transport system permease protein
MPIVVSQSHRWRVLAAHAFLIVFLVFTLFPLLLVIRSRCGRATALAC